MPRTFRIGRRLSILEPAVSPSNAARMALPFSVDDVRAAAVRIAGCVIRTPAVPAPAISQLTGARVSLKLETRQRTGAFKERGAANRLLQLNAEQRRGGVIAMSAGNHAQAVAYQASRLGIPATIVMPIGTPYTKVRRTEGFGARVAIVGETLADADLHARALATEHGFTMVHPYDDVAVAAGQGTIALEWLADVPDLEVLLVPIGGGGLIAGIAVAARAIRPGIEIVGVQTELFPSYYRVAHGLSAPMQSGHTIAEGIATKSIGGVALAVARELVDDVVLVSEIAIERAIHTYLDDEKLLTEGAGAAPLAALTTYADRFRGKKVGLVVCGGNIDTGLLTNVILRARLRDGRVARMRIETIDRPGMLADISRIIGERGANILEVMHQRSFHDVPSKYTNLDITIETRNLSDTAAIVRELSAADFPTRVLDSTTRPIETEAVLPAG